MTHGLTNREERSDGSRHPLGRSDLPIREVVFVRGNVACGNREEAPKGADGSRHPLSRSDTRYRQSTTAVMTAVTATARVREGTDRHPPTALMDNTDPVLPIDKIDPADPMERIDPALPIDAIEPAEPIDAIDPALPIDAIDPTDPIDAIDVDAESRFVIGPCMSKA